MTGCVGAGAPCQGERRQQRDNKPGCVFHGRPPRAVEAKGGSARPERLADPADGGCWVEYAFAAAFGCSRGPQAADAGRRRRAPEPWRKSLIELVFDRAAGNLRCPRGVSHARRDPRAQIPGPLRDRRSRRSTCTCAAASDSVSPASSSITRRCSRRTTRSSSCSRPCPRRRSRTCGRFPELAPLREQWTMIREEAQQPLRRGPHPRRARQQRRRLQFVLQARLEALLRQVVRRSAALGAGAVPAHGGAPRDHSLGQGRDVRDPRARRALESAPRSVRRVAALSPRPRHSQLGRLLHRGRRRALLVARRRGGDVRRDIHPLRRRTRPRRPASSCSATSSGRSPAGS